jgi:hypothetical protein
MFELISGYGTVGLSLGVANVRCRHSQLSALPTRCPSDTHPSLQDNYSLSGGFKTLSKLVVIAVMIRGRHRGLPVAIDRAVMLPKELLEVDADLEEETRARQSRRSRCVGKAACHPCPCVWVIVLTVPRVALAVLVSLPKHVPTRALDVTPTSPSPLALLLGNGLPSLGSLRPPKVTSPTNPHCPTTTPRPCLPKPTELAWALDDTPLGHHSLPSRRCLPLPSRATRREKT